MERKIEKMNEILIEKNVELKKLSFLFLFKKDFFVETYKNKC